MAEPAVRAGAAVGWAGAGAGAGALPGECCVSHIQAGHLVILCSHPSIHMFAHTQLPPPVHHALTCSSMLVQSSRRAGLACPTSGGSCQRRTRRRGAPRWASAPSSTCCWRRRGRTRRWVPLWRLRYGAGLAARYSAGLAARYGAGLAARRVRRTQRRSGSVPAGSGSGAGLRTRQAPPGSELPRAPAARRRDNRNPHRLSSEMGPAPPLRRSRCTWPTRSCGRAWRRCRRQATAWTRCATSSSSARRSWRSRRRQRRRARRIAPPRSWRRARERSRWAWRAPTASSASAAGTTGALQLLRARVQGQGAAPGPNSGAAEPGSQEWIDRRERCRLAGLPARRACGHHAPPSPLPSCWQPTCRHRRSPLAAARTSAPVQRIPSSASAACRSLRGWASSPSQLRRQSSRPQSARERTGATFTSMVALPPAIVPAILHALSRRFTAALQGSLT